MPILAAVMLPHPPLIIPEVGRGDEKRIQQTIHACETAAAFIAERKPQTVIVSSPHSLLYSDYFHLSPGLSANGSFAPFGAPQVKLGCTYDQELVQQIRALAQAAGLPAGTEGNRQPELDHATLIPLYFLNKYYRDYQVLRIGLSGLSLKEHYRLGMLVRQAAEDLGRRAVWIASGDLSHKLTPDGPYGFAAAGPDYDKKLIRLMENAQFDELFSFTETQLEEAAECGHRSFTMMAGALDGQAVKSRFLSYEGPFGVGYGVCLFSPAGKDETRHFADRYDAIRIQQRAEHLAREDEYIALARRVIEHFVRTGNRYLPLPPDLPSALLTQKAGVFVSLKKRGLLRGCIGTIGPLYDNIAEEIRHNAISACSEDPRFTPVTTAELDELEYSVDVLGAMEPIASPEQLDVQKYGVLVSKGSRSGLLLPHLEGVDTVEQQLDIARQKAGISPEESGLSLHRFQVERHEVKRILC